VNIEGKLAFNAAGELFLFEVFRARLNRVNQMTGQIISEVVVERGFQSFGIAFDPVGTLFLVDGGDGGTDTLQILETSTGALAAVGQTGLPSGLTSLVYIPEPGTFCVIGIGGLLLLRWRRRGCPFASREKKVSG
jgi:DNA-binding beta-propeller fold protein YncE